MRPFQGTVGEVPASRNRGCSKGRLPAARRLARRLARELTFGDGGYDWSLNDAP